MRKWDEILEDVLSGKSLSDEEQACLQSWKKTKRGSDLFTLLEKLEDVSALKERMNNRSDELPFAHIEEAVVQIKRRRTYRLASVAAACVVLLMGIALLVPSGWRAKEGEDHLRDFTALNSKARAELELPGGKKYWFDGMEENLIVLDGVGQFSSSQSTLSITGEQGKEHSEFTTLRIPLGAEYSVVLADGTKVYLNSGSELRFPVDFEADKREVYLNGEGFFEVAGDAVRPFVVYANQLTATVLGTSFNIKSYSEQDQQTVTLESGSLKVACLREEFLLAPGNHLAYQKVSGEVSMETVDTRLFTSWKDGYYFFEETRLEDIMETLSYWYNVEVAYLDEEVKGIEFSGRVKRYDEISVFLDSFEQVSAIDYTKDGDIITIGKRKTD